MPVRKATFQNVLKSAPPKCARVTETVVSPESWIDPCVKASTVRIEGEYVFIVTKDGERLNLWNNREMARFIHASLNGQQNENIQSLALQIDEDSPDTIRFESGQGFGNKISTFLSGGQKSSVNGKACFIDGSDLDGLKPDFSVSFSQNFHFLDEINFLNFDNYGFDADWATIVEDYLGVDIGSIAWTSLGEVMVINLDEICKDVYFGLSCSQWELVNKLVDWTVKQVSKLGGGDDDDPNGVSHVPTRFPGTSRVAVSIETSGNANHRGYFGVSCDESMCSIKGNTDKHSGLRSCTISCPVGAIVQFDCKANWVGERSIEDFEELVPEGSTLVLREGRQRQVYEWRASQPGSFVSADCRWTD